MASDWIPISKETPHKEEIATLAVELGVSRQEAFGHFFDLYSWADSRTADGYLPGMTLQKMAIASCVPLRVLEILASDLVKWLFVYDTVNSKRAPGVAFANWDRWNSKCAKARLMDTRRKAKERAKADSNRTKTGHVSDNGRT